MHELDKLAARRHEIHQHHGSSRPLSENYEGVGLSGEFAFGEFCGLMPDVKDRPSGDGGADFDVPLLFTVDVKTARKAYNLIHEAGKPFCDIYVLAEYSDATGRAELIGWEWGVRLQMAPTKDFGYGVINHYIPKEKLRPMSELRRRMLLVRRSERA